MSDQALLHKHRVTGVLSKSAAPEQSNFPCATNNVLGSEIGDAA